MNTPIQFIRRTACSGFLCLVFATGFYSSAFAANHAVILQYHHVDKGTPASTSVTPEQFDEHLNYLADNGFTIWPLQRIIDHLRQGKSVPDLTAAITIDDAYTSVYRESWPRLRARKWPFTVFVNTDATDLGKGAYLSWDQMREMHADGVVFANHSASHGHLIRRLPEESEAAWRQRIGADIDKAGDRLRTELGANSKLFAYPYGEFDPALQALLKSRGYTGIGQQSGPAWSGSNFLALPRFAMAANYARMGSFKLKVHTLPLPVVATSHDNPVLELSEWLPTLRLTIAEGDWSPSLNCFTNGVATESPDWIDRKSGTVEITATKKLVAGRNRTNCTARHKSQKRWFWYSHPWIRRHSDGSWYRE